MSIKNLIRMAVVLSVLIGASLIVPKIVYRKSGTAVFSAIAQDQWTKIIINKAQDEITLSRTGSIWQVSQSSYVYHADVSSTASLLDAAGELVLGDVISSNPGRHEVFQVTPMLGTRIRLFSTDPVNPYADFYLGKSTPDYTSYYLRYEGENKVYHSSGLSSYVVAKKFDRWRNRSLGIKDRELIDNIEFSKDQLLYAVMLDGDKWKYDGKEVDQNDMNSLLGQVASINAVDLVKPDEEDGIAKSFADAAAKIMISEAGKKHKITLYPITLYPITKKKDGKEQVEKYYAVKEDEPGIFILNNQIFENITKSFETIKQSSEKPPQEEAEGK
ncbi:MAG: DUF4340 domain-containing protein [bacterium]